MRDSCKWALLVGLAIALYCSGCVTPGSDPVVVNAERTTQLALDVFDTFLLWEYTNRETLQVFDPKIKEAADFIGARGQAWLETARAMTKAYKENRSPENRANLNTALAVLRAGMGEAERYFVKGVRQ
jgi:hypothetical protein